LKEYDKAYQKFSTAKDTESLYNQGNALAKGGNVPAWEQCSLFVQLGMKYPYNELRAGWQNAGKPIVQRLHDKSHNWEDLGKLIPEMMAEALMGYAFSCPDMVGGGSFETFLRGETDTQLIVRSAQVHALMPMMQFSLAPWRVLSREEYAAVLGAVALRNRFMPLIEQLYQRAAASGEPIVAPMEYVFPHQGLAGIRDQFMMGDFLMVAPVMEKGAVSRKVAIPPGKWIDDKGLAVTGPIEIEVEAPLSRLPHFLRVAR
jgi:alpha-glucosidase